MLAAGSKTSSATTATQQPRQSAQSIKSARSTTPQRFTGMVATGLPAERAQPEHTRESGKGTGRRAGTGRGPRAMSRRHVLTLDEIVALYLQDCRFQGLRPATLVGYERSLRCFLRWAAGEGIQSLPQFTAEAVKRYIAHV
jgi:hypothetical protein